MKVRINRYDNLRGLAIFFIVLWHLDIVDAIDPFIMRLIILTALPLFFFVSGYFSKIGPDEPLKAFRRLVIPYILFIFITNLFCFILFGDPIIVKDMFVGQTSIYWFLIALFLMKIMLPIVDKFKYPMIISIICALLIGFIDINPGVLGITRGVAYFPIFLLGFYYNDYKNKLEMEYGKYVEIFKKYYGIIVIIALIFVFVVVYMIPYTGPFLFKTNYKTPFHIFLRALIIISEFIVVLLFNRFMTNRECVLTLWGINSLTVYILHYYVFLSIKGILNGLSNSKMILIPMVLLLSFSVTFILSRNIFTVYLNKFTDFFYNLIVKTTDN